MRCSHLAKDSSWESQGATLGGRGVERTSEFLWLSTELPAEFPAEFSDDDDLDSSDRCCVEKDTSGCFCG